MAPHVGSCEGGTGRERGEGGALPVITSIMLGTPIYAWYSPTTFRESGMLAYAGSLIVDGHSDSTALLTCTRI